MAEVRVAPAETLVDMVAAKGAPGPADPRGD
jgi:hypothetical protein